MPQLMINVPWPQEHGVVARIDAIVQCENDVMMCQAVGIDPFVETERSSDRISTVVRTASSGGSGSSFSDSTSTLQPDDETDFSADSSDTESNGEDAPTMLDGHRTGLREVQLARDHTLAILEGTSDPIPQFDFDDSPKALQLGLIHLECQRNHRFARHFERLYERGREYDVFGWNAYDLLHLHLHRPRLPQHPTRLPQPQTPYTTPKTRGASLLRRSVLSALSEEARYQLRGWEETGLVMLFVVENDGPLYDKIVRVRNLNACAAEEYETEMRGVAERGWRDIIWVLRHEDDYPRGWRLARSGIKACLIWGEKMI